MNEGFDVLIPVGWGGDYSVLLYWPTGSTFCNNLEQTAWTGYILRAP